MSSSRFRLWLPAVLLSGVVGLAGCTQFQSFRRRCPADGGTRMSAARLTARFRGDGGLEAGPIDNADQSGTGALSLRW